MSEIQEKEPQMWGDAAEEKRPSSAQPQSEMQPFAVLVLMFVLFALGNLVGSGLILVLAKINNLDFNLVIKSLSENTPVGTRNFMRAVLFVNHLCAFILPAVVTALVVYKQKWLTGLKIDRLPSLRNVWLGFLLLVVSIPLVQYAYQINQMLPLPDWMRAAEDQTSRLLEAIIAKESGYEIIINVLLIAVVPALGEEMMFRGTLQRQIGRLFNDEHLTVWLSAAIFSAVHMQFEGFFARMILGALLGYLLVWTRNLWIPIIVHFLNNGLQLVALYAMNVKPSEADKLGQPDEIHWTLALASVFLIIMMSMLIQRAQITEGGHFEKKE